MTNVLPRYCHFASPVISRDPTPKGSYSLNGEVLVGIESVTTFSCTLSTNVNQPGDSVLRIHLKPARRNHQQVYLILV